MNDNLPRKIGILEAIGWVLCGALASAIACLVVFTISTITLGVDAAFESRFVRSVLLPGVASLVMLSIGRSQLKQRGERLSSSPIRWLPVLCVVLLAIPLFVVSSNIVFWIDSALGNTISWQAFVSKGESSDDVMSQQPFLTVLFFGCFLPGFCEETFFRGFLGRGLVARHGTVVGVIATSTLFAAVHLHLLDMASLFVLGIVLHLVYLWSGHIGPPMILHLVYNLIAYSVRGMDLEGTLYLESLIVDESTHIRLSAAAWLATLAMMFLLYRTQQTERHSIEQSLIPVEPTSDDHGAAFLNSCGEHSTKHRENRRVVLMAVVCYGTFVCVLGSAMPRLLDTSGVFASVRRGAYYLEFAQYAEASEAYTRAIELAPTLAESYIGRGEARLMLGENIRSMADWSQALELLPDSALAHAGRAACYQQIGLNQESMADCDRAIMLDKNAAWAYKIRASLHVEATRWTAASEDFSTVLRIAEWDAGTLLAFAELLSECPASEVRDPQEAIRMATIACELTMWKYDLAVQTLSRAYASADQKANAAQFAQMAREIAPNQLSPRTLRGLGIHSDQPAK